MTREKFNWWGSDEENSRALGLGKVQDNMDMVRLDT